MQRLEDQRRRKATARVVTEFRAYLLRRTDRDPRAPGEDEWEHRIATLDLPHGEKLALQTAAFLRPGNGGIAVAKALLTRLRRCSSLTKADVVNGLIEAGASVEGIHEAAARLPESSALRQLFASELAARSRAARASVRGPRGGHAHPAAVHATHQAMHRARKKSR